jgi:hypothetical protein
METQKINIELARLLFEEKKLDLIQSIIPLCKNYNEIINILEKINLLLQTVLINSNLECEYTNLEEEKPEEY